MRKHYLDNIRWATVLLVVLYHTIFMYNHVVTVGVVGPVTDCRWQDALQYLLYPWLSLIHIYICRPYKAAKVHTA